MAVKPTPTVSIKQRAVDMETMSDTELEPITRRDASLLPRIYPVCEAMVRIALVDAIMMANGFRSMMDLDPKWDKA
jgi:chorismate synthase